MNQNQKSPSDLQSLIQQYSRELLKANQRRTLSAAETPVQNPAKAASRLARNAATVTPQPTPGGPPSPSQDVFASIEEILKDDALPSLDFLKNRPFAPAAVFPAVRDTATPLSVVTRNGNFVPDEAYTLSPSQLRPSPFSVPSGNEPPFMTDGQLSESGLENTAEPRTFVFVDESPAPSPSELRPHLLLIEAEQTLAELEPDLDFEPEPVYQKRESESAAPTTGIALLQVLITAANTARPIRNATIMINRYDGDTCILQKETITGFNGTTPPLPLPAYIKGSLLPNGESPSDYTILVYAPGYYRSRHIHVALYGGVACVQKVELVKLPDGVDSQEEIVSDHALY